jgi:hypothetical protein
MKAAAAAMVVQPAHTFDEVLDVVSRVTAVARQGPIVK